MAILNRNHRQLVFIYSSTSQLAKKLLAYLQGADKKIQLIDINASNLGDSAWMEILEAVDKPFTDIVNTKKVSFIDDSVNLSRTDAIKVLNKNPEVLEKPILANDSGCVQISSQSDILEYFDVTSAGLDKKDIHKGKTVTNRTKDEDFTL